jgi:hypothetical protein
LFGSYTFASGRRNICSEFPEDTAFFGVFRRFSEFFSDPPVYLSLASSSSLDTSSLPILDPERIAYIFRAFVAFHIPLNNKAIACQVSYFLPPPSSTYSPPSPSPSPLPPRLKLLVFPPPPPSPLLLPLPPPLKLHFFPSSSTSHPSLVSLPNPLSHPSQDLELAERASKILEEIKHKEALLQHGGLRTSQSTGTIFLQPAGDVDSDKTPNSGNSTKSGGADPEALLSSDGKEQKKGDPCVFFSILSRT